MRRLCCITWLGLLLAALVVVGGCAASTPTTAPPKVPAVENKVNNDLTPAVRQLTWDAYEKVLQEVSASQFPVDPIMAQKRLKGRETAFLIIDLRATDVYAQKHVKGAVNMSVVALAENLANLPKDKTLLLYCYTGQSSALAMVPLKAFGYNAIFVNGGFPLMEKAGFVMDTKGVVFVPVKNAPAPDNRQATILAGIQANLLAIAKQHTVKTLVVADTEVKDLAADSPEKYAFVDLRPPDDYAKGHIKGAISAPLAELRTRSALLPKDKRLVLCCKSGQLAAMATAPLTAEGFKIISLCAGLSQADKGPLPWEKTKQ
jgi:rhodanese-related sulfurtransferase